ncbi:DUF1398 domain-containing protein [Halpernia sp.]|uniref:DUF1398 domain-containing protein n=1 Tax=Halpernia sp. TaxID=2782209 RepID=UPI003A916CEE
MKFNSDQIHQAQIKSQGNFPILVDEFKKIGVANFITLVTDGHSEYFDAENENISVDGNQDLIISNSLNKEKFTERLKMHQNGKTDFSTFCKDCAENGVDNWIVDLDKMTCTYYDKIGKQVLTENIPSI